MAQLDTASTQRRMKHRFPVRSLVAASVGNALEWYDWTIFGLFSIYFSVQFFDPANEQLAFINTFVAYAIAFFFRPLGGILLGRFADLRGRKPALLLTILLMAGGSIVIGVVPTFEVIGWVAPIVLVLARIAQGIAVGGEVANASAYLAEIAPNAHRARYGSFFQISTASAVLLASLTGYFLVRVIGEAGMEAWGWRIPFVVGGLLGAVGIWLRSTLAETELFETQGRTERVKHPFLQTLRHHPRSVVQIVGITMISTLLFYTYFAAMTPYATRTAGADPADVFLALSIGTVVFIALQYPTAWMSDTLGRKPMLLAATALTAAVTVPLSLLVGPALGPLVVTFVVGLAIYSIITSMAPAIMSELFPTQLRGLGIGAWYNLTVAVFGGTAPLVLSLFTAGGNATAFFWYVSAASVVAFLIVAFTLRETKGIELS